MQLDFTPEERAFREEVRAFIAEHYPADVRAKQEQGLELDEGGLPELASDRREAGLVGAGLAGGVRRHGLDATQRYIFDEELQRADTAPDHRVLDRTWSAR